MMCTGAAAIVMRRMGAEVEDGRDDDVEEAHDTEGSEVDTTKMNVCLHASRAGAEAEGTKEGVPVGNDARVSREVPCWLAGVSDAASTEVSEA